MKRFLVIFRSHPSPPVDETVIDVTAPCALSAILTAKREVQLQHGWTFVQVVPWPRGYVDVEDAAYRVANGR